MKIAVTYDNGEVFQHFGHSENFKIYDVDQDGKVVSSNVIGTDGAGHEALADLLADEEVDILICGGIGGGAMQALDENGIDVCSGASGSADKAVEDFLAGILESTGVNCDHHHGEGHDDHEHSCGSHSCHDESSEEEDCGGCGGCSDDEEAGCGGGCGGCSGCHSTPLFEGKNVGKTCRVHYTGTFNNGEKFDSSYDRGQTLDFVCGMGMMIHGFDKAVAEMNVGDIVDIHLTPNEAYGEIDPDAIIKLQISELPGSEDLTIGQQVYLQDIYGRPIPVKVIEKTETEITFDANHEMAGKELNFKIELVEIAD
ncbi:NifB/NifX family molybdenum-iron cluster-binding protein [Butyrivibrio sp. VCB2006]|uniref:NifB/NifX family molybdenum-iron cluster-binding protein n=1 Tax=Butyrivibrio sp. VCB2006 TaxID=1280679 RepID=UPI00040D31A0|nr:NifB/NifX family molybdenum-iron cluster-binding protein [Butyrivibrio sp. VCB2006]